MALGLLCQEMIDACQKKLFCLSVRSDHSFSWCLQCLEDLEDALTLEGL